MLRGQGHSASLAQAAHHPGHRFAAFAFPQPLVAGQLHRVQPGSHIFPLCGQGFLPLGQFLQLNPQFRLTGIPSGLGVGQIPLQGFNAVAGILGLQGKLQQAHILLFKLMPSVVDFQLQRFQFPGVDNIAAVELPLQIVHPIPQPGGFPLGFPVAGLNFLQPAAGLVQGFLNPAQGQAALQFLLHLGDAAVDFVQGQVHFLKGIQLLDGSHLTRLQL